MFNSELLLTSVDGNSQQIEIIWDESREAWLYLLIEELAKPSLKLIGIE